MVKGKSRDELGELQKEGKVQIVVDDDGAFPTMGKRVKWVDTNGQAWVKLNGKYWKYPEHIEH